jgi:predicted ABC-type ATPase
MTEAEAKEWVKDKTNQETVVKRFFEDYPPHQRKMAFFMAGIPGAGKTEFAENTINRLKPKLVPIEHDKLVEYIPGYRPEDYYNFRTAGSALVTRLLDECLKNGYGFIFDGTLSHEHGYRNIEKTLKNGYFVQIVYIVQTAQAAWALTKDRELVKKRAIEKEGFIATCNKINMSLLNIFQRFKDRDNFGLWIFNKNGKIGIGKATTILYSKDIGTGSEVEKSLQQTYNTSELE